MNERTNKQTNTIGVNVCNKTVRFVQPVTFLQILFFLLQELFRARGKLTCGEAAGRTLPPEPWQTSRVRRFHPSTLKVGIETYVS